MIVSKCPSPFVTRDAELLVADDERVDTTLPVEAEYILTAVPTIEKK